jgi:hypothetical protein
LPTRITLLTLPAIGAPPCHVHRTHLIKILLSPENVATVFFSWMHMT